MQALKRLHFNIKARVACVEIGYSKKKKSKLLFALLDTVLWPDCIPKSKEIEEVISSFVFNPFIKKY